MLFIAGIITGLSATIIVIEHFDKQRGLSAYYLASEYYEQNEYDSALVPLCIAISKLPNDYGPFYLAGELYQKSGNSKFALAMYRKALEVIKVNEQNDKKKSFDPKDIEEKIVELESKILK